MIVATIERVSSKCPEFNGKSIPLSRTFWRKRVAEMLRDNRRYYRALLRSNKKDPRLFYYADCVMIYFYNCNDDGSNASLLQDNNCICAPESKTNIPPIVEDILRANLASNGTVFLFLTAHSAK